MFKSNHCPQRNRKTNPCIRCRKHYLQNALRTSGLPELIYIKCRICKYRYMPDRLRRFKAEFFQALATLRVLRSSSSFTMGNWRPARSLNA
jgi:hypothetical protein